ncbi:hypothetical protein [Nostoc sp.]|uniref:hypothetical protein n=1 Tax=Nostoc sp. TaxID=1180 RepID=UPI002FEF8AF7
MVKSSARARGAARRIGILLIIFAVPQFLLGIDGTTDVVLLVYLNADTRMQCARIIRADNTKLRCQIL